MPVPVGYPATANEARQVARDFGKCLYFDGVDGKVVNDATAHFTTSTPVTIYGWVMPLGTTTNSYDSQPIMVTKYHYVYQKTAALYGRFDNGSASEVGGVPYKARWHHFVYVYNPSGANGEQRFYLDGEQTSTLPNSSKQALNSYTEGIGTNGSTYGNFKLDKAGVIEGALTSEEALQLYTGHKEPDAICDDRSDDLTLLYNYECNDDAATVTDSSGNAKDGTITGGVTYVTDKVMTTRSTVSDRFLLPTSAQKSLLVPDGAGRALTTFLPAQTGFCIGFWLMRRSDTANRAIISNRAGSPQNGLRVDFILGTTRWLWCYGDDNASVTINAPGANNVAIGVWNYVLITYVPNQFRFYLNLILGLEDTSCSIGDAHGINLYIGSAFNSSASSGFYISRLTTQNTTTIWTAQEQKDLMYRNILPIRNGADATQWSLNNTLLDQNGANALTASGTSFVDDAPFQPRSVV